MIEIPMGKNFSNHREKLQDYCQDCDPCIVCGKPSKSPKYYIRLFWESHAVFEDEAQAIILKEGHGGDMLYYPVGTACLKKYPELKPYVRDAIKNTKKDG